MQQEVTNKIFTVANILTLVRLCMAPIALFVFLSGHDIVAALIFGITAATDFLDGQIARRTHTVSYFGQILDPVVDRVLMICGVVGLLVIGRLPIWLLVLVLARDFFLIIGGSWLLRRYKVRVPVIFAGKVATTLLFVGLAGLMLNMPQLPGLGWCEYAWLPGFNSVSSSWGIWLIYLGLCLALLTTIYYVFQAKKRLREAMSENE